MSPKNDLISFGVLGIGKFFTALILSGLGMTPDGVMMCPRYATSFFRNSYLSNCILKFASRSLSNICLNFVMCSSKEVL